MRFTNICRNCRIKRINKKGRKREKK